MAKRADITPELLRQLLRYEPETGMYFWKERPASMFSSEGYCKKWNTQYANKQSMTTKGGDNYYQIRVLGINFKAHRVVWAMHYGEWPNGSIDHINGVQTDNRITNLRVVSHSENLKNMGVRKNNTSGVVGVCWDKREHRWKAFIRQGGKMFNLGNFDKIEDATQARKKAEIAFGFHPNHGTRKANNWPKKVRKAKGQVRQGGVVKSGAQGMGAVEFSAGD